jgi:hypothetical protein
MSKTILCNHAECSIAQLCKRFTANAVSLGKGQTYLKEIEYNEENKCTSFLPLHSTAEKLYRLATFPARASKKEAVVSSGSKLRRKKFVHN